MIQFIEDSSRNYAHRTYINAASADLTMAFAADFNSSGELCTENAVKKANKKLVQFPMNIEEINKMLPNVIEYIKDCKTLNVAGNGLSRLCHHNITQEMSDNIVLYTLEKLKNDYGIEFETIRSGGQTGADESGLKAAVKIGTKEIICLCPKNWRFRDEKQDYSDENLFKSRFL
ncbi:MAG: hypothetical protein IKT40_08785 [Bacilli bacterium]|nr:hypothetical protein [Bacilli bacterium]